MRNFPSEDRHRDRPRHYDDRSAPRHYDERSNPRPYDDRSGSRSHNYDDRSSGHQEREYYPSSRREERLPPAPPPPPPPPPPPVPVARNPRRIENGHMVYGTNHNPDITMHESEDYKSARRGRYERSINRYEPNSARDYGSYPRNDREFGNSIREERRAVGDLYNGDSYRPREQDIDFGNFQRRDEPQSRMRHPRPYDDLENSLGYFP